MSIEAHGGTAIDTARKAAAWSALGATAMLAVAHVVLAIIEPEATGIGPGRPNTDPGGVPLAAIDAVAMTAFGAMGALVVSRHSRNPVGWLLVLIGLSFGALTVGNDVYYRVLLTTGDAKGIGAYAGWLCNWMWLPLIVPAFTILPLLFPTGRPLSPRWRAVVWTAVVAGVVTFAGTAFVPGPLDSYPAALNPLGIDSPAVVIVGWVGFGVLVPTAFASIASLVVRFRRSRGVERQQLKWIALAAGLLPVAFSGSGLAGSSAEWPILLAGLLFLAGAVAIAMLRYRLYDIDVVINRTLVYGALTATLAATYLGSVLLLQLILSVITAGSGLAVAASTLAVAALFRPLRTRIQATVDRRFYRRKYDAAHTLERFGAHLRDEVDLDAIGGELRVVVAETMQPTHVTLWLRGSP